MTSPLLEMRGDELIFDGEKLADLSPVASEYTIKQFEYWLEFITEEVDNDSYEW
jgi:hypothetical protein|tara:strand:- start:1142 stop:1303 length:162 start_codon:yes stop_codon:yes gene_type:complete